MNTGKNKLSRKKNIKLTKFIANAECRQDFYRHALLRLSSQCKVSCLSPLGPPSSPGTGNLIASTLSSHVEIAAACGLQR